MKVLTRKTGALMLALFMLFTLIGPMTMAANAAGTSESTGTAAKLAIRTIISKVTHNESYGELRYDLPKTDPGDRPGTVRLFYSGKSVNATWDLGATWNREHVWPKSLGWYPRENSARDAGGDIHCIRPADPHENTSRSNKKFGEGGGYFAPDDNYKGDVARLIFYMLVRYSETDSRYPVTNVAQSMAVLLRWNKLDPVDETEIIRNNEAYAIQGNRNPFIDCPSLADTIWGNAA